MGYTPSSLTRGEALTDRAQEREISRLEFLNAIFLSKWRRRWKTMTNGTKSDVPQWLSPEYHELWQELSNRAGNRQKARRMLLKQTFRLLERLGDVTDTLSKDGILTTSERSGLKHLHPLVKTERDLRQQLLKYTQLLGLHRFSSMGNL